MTIIKLAEKDKPAVCVCRGIYLFSMHPSTNEQVENINNALQLECKQQQKEQLSQEEIIEDIEATQREAGLIPLSDSQQALLQLVDSTVGGRRTVLTLPYCVPAKFQGWQSELWSLKVKLVSSFSFASRLYRVQIEFLAIDAPVEVLRPGAQFALYEGTRIIAVGQCI